MTTATQNEEDLIIIWDETSNDTSMLDFDFSQTTAEAETIQDIQMIDFSPAEISNEVSVDFALDSKAQETTSQEIDFGTDFFANTEVALETSDVQIEETKENVDFETNLFWETTTQEITSELEVQNVATQEVDFGFAWETTTSQENTFLETSTKDSFVESTNFDRNTILDEAIAKMQSRKWTISWVKSTKKSSVDELNKQIASLKSQVSDLEKEIKDLEKEDSALDLDISSIEKMKTSVLEVSTDRPRKHNLSNIKK